MSLEDLDDDPVVTYSSRTGFSPEETPQGDVRGAPANGVPDPIAFPETITTASAIAGIPASAELSAGQPLGGIDLGSPYSAFSNRSEAARSSGTPNVQHDGEQGGDTSTVGSAASYWRSSLYQPSTSWPLNTEEEARLFHHFVRNLGAWVRPSPHRPLTAD